MKTHSAIAERLFSALLVLAMLVSGISPCAKASAGAEPETSYESDVFSLHVGDTHQWKPFADYPELQVTYQSSDPDVLSITTDGLITALHEGEATVTAATVKTEEYKSAEHECFIVVFPSADGLYLSEMCTYFYYQGEKYRSGELPLDVERELCLTQEDLRIYLQDYLYPYQKKIPDRTEAALTAIINYGANYFRSNFKFESVPGRAEDAKEDWMRMIVTRKGLCVACSSMFCYLMYLAGLPSMIVETPESQMRAHDWNLIEHNGYYFNLENHVFLHYPYDRYILPPFSNATAAYFPGNIYGCWYMHYPVAGGSFGPDKSVSSMGRDLSNACPILICEKESNGEYIAHFETIRKNDIPVYENGTPVLPEEVIYRNMETGDGMAEGGNGDQLNEEAVPLFTEANHMLFSEIVGLFNTFILPSSTVSIDEQAFFGTETEYVIIPDTAAGIAIDAIEASKGQVAVSQYGSRSGIRE